MTRYEIISLGENGFKEVTSSKTVPSDMLFGILYATKNSVISVDQVDGDNLTSFELDQGLMLMGNLKNLVVTSGVVIAYKK